MKTSKTALPRSAHISHVAGDAASVSLPAGTDPAPGPQEPSDWMAEMKRRPGDAVSAAGPAPVPTQQPGVVVSTRPRDGSRGRAVESKRGQRS